MKRARILAYSLSCSLKYPRGRSSFTSACTSCRGRSHTTDGRHAYSRSSYEPADQIDDLHSHQFSSRMRSRFHLARAGAFCLDAVNRGWFCNTTSTESRDVFAALFRFTVVARETTKRSRRCSRVPETASRAHGGHGNNVRVVYPRMQVSRARPHRRASVTFLSSRCCHWHALRIRQCMPVLLHFTCIASV
jgi:hypothetical protein